MMAEAICDLVNEWCSSFESVEYDCLFVAFGNEVVTKVSLDNLVTSSTKSADRHHQRTRGHPSAQHTVYKHFFLIKYNF